MNNTYTVTKTSVELYKFRHPSGAYWADITIDSGEKTGRISISSDFGNFANYWGACGSSFKSFLCSLDIWYAANKFGASDWFDHEGTIKHFREEVKRLQSDHSIDKEKAALLREEISELTDYSHRESFVCAIMDKEHLMNMYDGQPDLQTDIQPGFKKLWEMVWPEMIKVFKAEESEGSNG